jgi:hypothetical protein
MRIVSIGSWARTTPQKSASTTRLATAKN